jgi:hypothetical protein
MKKIIRIESRFNFGNDGVIFKTKFSVFAGVHNLRSSDKHGAILWFSLSIPIPCFRLEKQLFWPKD